MRGVGEALKREIAGLVLVGRLLWGFDRWACLGSGLTDPLHGLRWAPLGYAQHQLCLALVDTRGFLSVLSTFASLVA